MSYKLKILADNPVGYWTLNGNNSDVTSASNSASFSNISYIAPPIVANSGSSLKISPSSSISITGAAGLYDAFDKNTTTNAFTIAFWFDFNNQIPGSGYGQTVYENNQLKILSITSNSTEVGKIYYDYAKNTFRFAITGSTNLESYYVVRNFDSQFYIVASYDNKELTLRVNNEEGVAGYVIDTAALDSVSKTSLSYKINGSSLTGTARNFIISELAFYDRKIKKQEIKNHLIWGFRDADPELISMSRYETDLLKFDENPNNNSYKEVVRGKQFANAAVLHNLDVTDSGLSIKYINSPVFKNIESSATYTISGSGIAFSGIGAIDFSVTNNPQIINDITISMNVSRGTINSENLFSIPNFGTNGNYFYLQSTSSAYSLYLYDVSTTSVFHILSSSAAPVAGSANVAVRITTDTLYLYSSDTGQVNFDISTSSISNYFINNTYNSIILGNNYYSASTTYSKIKNFGVTTIGILDLSTINFSAPTTYLMKLSDSNNPFFVSQAGHMIKVVPFSISNITNGSKIDWNSMSNCIVSVATTTSGPFTKIERGQSITDIIDSNNFVIRIDMYSEYEQETKNQSFNNLFLVGYETQNYDINQKYAFATASNVPNVMPTIKETPFGILSRPNNFGIKFSSSSNTLPSFASVTPVSSSYQAIEFWYRPDNINSSSVHYLIMNATSSATEPALYLSGNNFYYAGAKLYVNGASVTSGGYSASINELYHIILNCSASAGTFYINGDAASSLYRTACATYGYLTLWSEAPSASTVSDRYQSFIGVKTSQISDANSTKIIPNVNSDSVSIFKIG